MAAGGLYCLPLVYEKDLLFVITIQKQIESVHIIAGIQKYDSHVSYRRTFFSKMIQCAEGILLYHSLTGELLLLENGENFENPELQQFFAEHWFLVPQDFDETNHCDQIKKVATLLEQDKKSVHHYTVFTTTDCNARCFYCFERGQRRYSMSEQTARDVAAYMIAHANGDRIKVRWFGGEPLVNAKAIDSISEELQKSGVDYEASMVSNAYLFDEVVINRAKDLWHLKHVLITIDGTEDVYNRTKAYIHSDDSAYRTVLHNIRAILDAGIRVTVNLNMDAANAADLYQLADELGRSFIDSTVFDARGVLLVEYIGKIHSFSTTQQALQALLVLNQKLKLYGIQEKKRLHSGLLLHNCMADDMHSVTVLPDGRLGRCEHFGDSEEVGSIYGGWDECKMNTWKERKQIEEECKDCVRYPICIRLKKCNSISGVCNELSCAQKKYDLESRIMNTYEDWKKREGWYETNM